MRREIAGVDYEPFPHEPFPRDAADAAFLDRMYDAWHDEWAKSIAEWEPDGALGCVLRKVFPQEKE